MKTFLLRIFLAFLVLSLAHGEDNVNEKFLFNNGKCEQNNYFDEDFFKCRFCDPNFNLAAVENSELDHKIIISNI